MTANLGTGAGSARAHERKPGSAPRGAAWTTGLCARPPARSPPPSATGWGHWTSAFLRTAAAPVPLDSRGGAGGVRASPPGEGRWPFKAAGGARGRRSLAYISMPRPAPPPGGSVGRERRAGLSRRGARGRPRRAARPVSAMPGPPRPRARVPPLPLLLLVLAARGGCAAPAPRAEDLSLGVVSARPGDGVPGGRTPSARPGPIAWSGKLRRGRGLSA